MSARKLVQYVELDIGWGACVYGVAPCTAAIGVTGSIKCFNTIATCQDRPHIDLQPTTLRFAKATQARASDIEALGSIVNIDFTPARLAPGENLGTRASLRITFKDHPHSDTGPGFDKYLSDRPYDPFKQGSFFSKFRARQPYLRGEALRWRIGFAGQALDAMETRHFLVESFNGPTPEGIYTLVAKDVLKLADGDRALAPRPSNGILNASINNSVTSLTLSPAGIGNEEYPASGWVNIGRKEVVSFTRSGDVLTIVRGQRNTTAVAHDANEGVQLCLFYDGEDPADIGHDLFTGYTPGFDEDWISLPTWQGETAAFLRRDYTRFIAEPTSVNQLVSELCEQAGLAIWWDDIAEQMRLQVMRQIATDAALFDDSLNLVDTLKVNEQPQKRVSTVFTAYAQNNPLKNLDDKDNYRQWKVTEDTDSDAFYGQSSIRKLYAAWIPFGGTSAAERANDLLIGRYSRPPREFAFSLFRGAQAAPVLGGGYQIAARSLQDATGAPEIVPIQIIEVRPTDAGWDVLALEMRYRQQASDDFVNKTITIDVSANGINLRSLHDSLFFDPQPGDSVTCIVEEGVIVGATEYGLPAFDIGDWPSQAQSGTRTNANPTITGLADTSDFAAGMFVTGAGIPAGAKILSKTSTTITLDQNAMSGGTATVTVWTVTVALKLRGRLQGAGGLGGLGASFGPGQTNDPTNGFYGTMALYTRVPMDLDLTEGEGKAFGGGGGGGGADILNLDGSRGGGGGGGAGIPPGPGGIGPGAAQEGSAGTTDGGGLGGGSYATFSNFVGPYYTGVAGGLGGGPGLPGTTGGHHGGNLSEQSPGTWGGPGPAIDGISFVKKSGTGDIRGPEVN